MYSTPDVLLNAFFFSPIVSFVRLPAKPSKNITLHEFVSIMLEA